MVRQIGFYAKEEACVSASGASSWYGYYSGGSHARISHM
jgi:hypothetical protein